MDTSNLLLEDEQFRRRTEHLLDELADVQARIRQLDPSTDSTDEETMPDPAVADLVNNRYQILRELGQRQTLIRDSLAWTRHHPNPPRSIGALVHRVWPPQLVDVRDGDVWKPAQLEGIEIAPNGRAHVRIYRDDGVTLGPLTPIDAGATRPQRGADGPS